MDVILQEESSGMGVTQQHKGSPVAHGKHDLTQPSAQQSLPLNGESNISSALYLRGSNVVNY